MNWEAVGAIGEIVGAIAVVGTVAYLAAQTRQANLLARSNAALMLQAENRSHRNALAQDRELAEIVEKALRGEKLDDVERLRYQARFDSSMSYFESVFLQVQSGILQKEYLQRYDNVICTLVRTGVELGVERTAGLKEFEDYVDRLLERSAT